MRLSTFSALRRDLEQGYFASSLKAQVWAATSSSLPLGPGSPQNPVLVILCRNVSSSYMILNFLCLERTNYIETFKHIVLKNDLHIILLF
jgi:hypothetical protein